MSANPQKQKETKANLLKLIECPICAEIMSGQIELCVSGHSICRMCKEKVDVCPLCKGEYPGIRNRLAEEFASQMFVQPCENAPQGCLERLAIGQIEAHEHACPFRLYTCRMCKERVCFKTLKVHFERQHPENTMKECEFRRVTQREDRPDCSYTYQLDAHGELFWFWRRNAQRHVFMSVQYVGTALRAAAFRFRLHLVSADGLSDVMFTGPVHSDVELSSSVEASSKCAIVNTDFLKEGAKFKVTILKK